MAVGVDDCDHAKQARIDAALEAGFLQKCKDASGSPVYALTLPGLVHWLSEAGQYPAAR